MTTTIFSNNRAYDLQIDTIYYIAGNDNKLNNFIIQNTDKIEKLLNSDKNRYFDFHFQYLSLDTLSDDTFRELLQLNIPNIDDKMLDTLLSQSKNNLESFKHNNNYNLTARIIPSDPDDYRYLSAQISDTDTLNQISQFISDLAEENLHFYPTSESETYEDFEQSPKSSKYKPSKYNSHTSKNISGFNSKRPLFEFMQNSESHEGTYEEQSDSTCPNFLKEKAEKIRDEIAELKRKNGINYLIEILSSEFLQTLKEIPKIQPSKLVVTNEFNITLPDYDLAVQMNALSKTLYFLFLIYPEGIRLKELDKYQNTLMEIYKLVSNRENHDKMIESIKDLTNPCSNSVNEKLSRIHKAFHNIMATDLAQEYIPYGIRGEKKHIALDTDKIFIPESLKTLIK